MVDFAFYLDVFVGNMIPGEDFPRLATRAGDILDFLEREYTVTGSELAKNKATCALAEAVHANERAASAALSAVEGNGAIASESIGSVSVSYQKATAADAGLDLTERGMKRRYYDVARQYLTIYRGVR